MLVGRPNLTKNSNLIGGFNTIRGHRVYLRGIVRTARVSCSGVQFGANGRGPQSRQFCKGTDIIPELLDRHTQKPDR